MNYRSLDLSESGPFISNLKVRILGTLLSGGHI